VFAADAIVEVGDEMLPNGATHPFDQKRYTE